eukprot:6177432-Pleurochrysis_carterae.AAC.1
MKERGNTSDCAGHWQSDFCILNQEMYDALPAATPEMTLVRFGIQPFCMLKEALPCQSSTWHWPSDSQMSQVRPSTSDMQKCTGQPLQGRARFELVARSRTDSFQPLTPELACSTISDSLGICQSFFRPDRAGRTCLYKIQTVVARERARARRLGRACAVGRVAQCTVGSSSHREHGVFKELGERIANAPRVRMRYKSKRANCASECRTAKERRARRQFVNSRRARARVKLLIIWSRGQNAR